MLPQHSTDPVARRAQAEVCPAAMAVALVTQGTGVAEPPMLPQHSTDPAERRAQARSYPAATACTPDSPGTVTGVRTPGSPEHSTIPAEVTSHVSYSPSARFATPVTPVVSGVGDPTVVPFPNLPRLVPQQRTAFPPTGVGPSQSPGGLWTRAHVVPPFVATAIAPEMLRGVGVVVSASPPSTSTPPPQHEIHSVSQQRARRNLARGQQRHAAQASDDRRHGRRPRRCIAELTFAVVSPARDRSVR